jgi:hypothetical protein
VIIVMPPYQSNPVKISIVFGIVWAFLAAYIVSNMGKNAGYYSPNVFVSILSGLLAGAGIGTGSYYLFKKINTNVTSINQGYGASAGGNSGGAGGAPGDLGDMGSTNWNNAITQAYILNQAAGSEERTAQTLQQMGNFIPSATSCVPGNLTALQISACAAAGFPVTPGTTPATSATAPATSGTAPATSGTAPATSGTPPATSGTTPATSGTPPATPSGSSSPTVAFQLNAAGCAAQNLTADQELQCIFAGLLNSGQSLTPYQLQQLSKETGIPLTTLQTALAGATQASMAQDFAAVQQAGITPTLQIPPKDAPASATPKPSNLINTKAAVGLSIAVTVAFTFFLWYARGDLTGTKQNVFIFLSVFLVISSLITVGLVTTTKNKQPAYVMGGLSLAAFVGVAIFAGVHGKDLFNPVANNPVMARLTNLSSSIAGNTMTAMVGALGTVMFITGTILFAYVKKNPKSARAGQMKNAAIPLISIGGAIMLGSAIYSFTKSKPAANTTPAEPPAPLPAGGAP